MILRKTVSTRQDLFAKKWLRAALGVLLTASMSSENQPYFISMAIACNVEADIFGVSQDPLHICSLRSCIKTDTLHRLVFFQTNYADCPDRGAPLRNR